MAHPLLDRLELGFRRRVPMVLQTEASECGLASLAMIAGYLGYSAELTELRRRHAISIKGATLREVVAIADTIGLAARPLRLDMDELVHLRMPCILHWDLNHFVVLTKVAGSKITIHDPAAGLRVLDASEASRHFTGIALELTPTAQFALMEPPRRLKAMQLLGRIQGLKQSLGGLLALALALEVVAMVSPFFLGWVVDQALVSGDRDLLTTLAIGFFLLLLLQSGLGAMRTWMLLGISSSLKVQSRANLFTHLVNLPTSFFEARHIGDVMSRFGSQDTILSAITTELVEAFLDGIMAAMTLLIMFIFAPDLTMLVVAGALIYAALRWVSYTPLRRASMEAIVWGARRDTHFLETLRGIRTVKLFNAQEDRRTRWLNLLIENINRQLTTQKLRLFFKGANKLLMGIMKIAVIWIGAYKVLGGGFTVGLLLAFIAYKDQFLERVSELINKGVDLKMLRLHADRVSDIALTQPEPRSTRSPGGAKHLAPTVELRDIRFRYAESEPWILDGVSCTIRRGESVAIVGPSGGGKTTLLKIFAGLIVPTEGEMLINGEPVRKIGMDRYREMIGVVMQDDQLFSGSIADNICFFAEEPDLGRIEQCARAAAVHDDIAAMPMGYDTLMGDMGTVLSGGQKQRVFIARALYRMPGILLLDEATSHLDVDREYAVNEMLRSMHLTRIVVAHRPETIRTSDRILKLCDGVLTEESLRWRAQGQVTGRSEEALAYQGADETV